MDDVVRHADGTPNWQHYASRGRAVRGRALRAAPALVVRSISRWVCGISLGRESRGTAASDRRGVAMTKPPRPTEPTSRPRGRNGSSAASAEGRSSPGRSSPGRSSPGRSRTPIAREDGLKAAIAAAGGVGKLAKLVGVAQSSVSRWKRVPADRVLAIETITGLGRDALRPDLHPPRRAGAPHANGGGASDAHAVLRGRLVRLRRAHERAVSCHRRECGGQVA